MTEFIGYFFGVGDTPEFSLFTPAHILPILLLLAVIFLISIISLLLMKGVDLLQKKCMPWEKE